MLPARSSQLEVSASSCDGEDNKDPPREDPGGDLGYCIEGPRLFADSVSDKVDVLAARPTLLGVG
jgi:hypothetical protein